MLPIRLNVVHAIRTTDAKQLEASLHKKFSSKRVRGEWFALSASDIESIASIDVNSFMDADPPVPIDDDPVPDGLAEMGLLTLTQAAKRRSVSTRTVERWRDEHNLRAIVLGSGRRKTYLFRPADVDAFTPPPRGAPEGNRNAAKKKIRKKK